MARRRGACTSSSSSSNTSSQTGDGRSSSRGGVRKLTRGAGRRGARGGGEAACPARGTRSAASLTPATSTRLTRASRQQQQQVVIERKAGRAAKQTTCAIRQQRSQRKRQEHVNPAANEPTQEEEAGEELETASETQQHPEVAAEKTQHHNEEVPEDEEGNHSGETEQVKQRESLDGTAEMGHLRESCHEAVQSDMQTDEIEGESLPTLALQEKPHECQHDILSVSHTAERQTDEAEKGGTEQAVAGLPSMVNLKAHVSAQQSLPCEVPQDVSMEDQSCIQHSLQQSDSAAHQECAAPEVNQQSGEVSSVDQGDPVTETVGDTGCSPGGQADLVTETVEDTGCSPGGQAELANANSHTVAQDQTDVGDDVATEMSAVASDESAPSLEDNTEPVNSSEATVDQPSAASYSGVLPQQETTSQSALPVSSAQHDTASFSVRRIGLSEPETVSRDDEEQLTTDQSDSSTDSRGSHKSMDITGLPVPTHCEREDGHAISTSDHPPSGDVKFTSTSSSDHCLSVSTSKEFSTSSDDTDCPSNRSLVAGAVTNPGTGLHSPASSESELQSVQQTVNLGRCVSDNKSQHLDAAQSDLSLDQRLNDSSEAVSPCGSQQTVNEPDNDCGDVPAISSQTCENLNDERSAKSVSASSLSSSATDQLVDNHAVFVSQEEVVAVATCRDGSHLDSNSDSCMSASDSPGAAGCSCEVEERTVVAASGVVDVLTDRGDDHQQDDSVADDKDSVDSLHHSSAPPSSSSSSDIGSSHLMMVDDRTDGVHVNEVEVDARKRNVEIGENIGVVYEKPCLQSRVGVCCESDGEVLERQVDNPDLSSLSVCHSSRRSNEAANEVLCQPTVVNNSANYPLEDIADSEGTPEVPDSLSSTVEEQVAVVTSPTGSVNSQDRAASPFMGVLAGDHSPPYPSTVSSPPSSPSSIVTSTCISGTEHCADSDNEPLVSLFTVSHDPSSVSHDLSTQLENAEFFCRQSAAMKTARCVSVGPSLSKPQVDTPASHSTTSLSTTPHRPADRHVDVTAGQSDVSSAATSSVVTECVSVARDVESCSSSSTRSSSPRPLFRFSSGPPSCSPSHICSATEQHASSHEQEPVCDASVTTAAAAAGAVVSDASLSSQPAERSQLPAVSLAEPSVPAPQRVKKSWTEPPPTTSQPTQASADNEQKLRNYTVISESFWPKKQKQLSKQQKQARRMVCDCVLSVDEVQRGVMGCGDDCLNRLLMIECGSRCMLGELCSNKRFARREYCSTSVFKTDKKGFGLRAVCDIEAGGFIYEYVGEVLGSREFSRRARQYDRLQYQHHYFMALSSDLVIDATQRGNASRFINHSCEPNCETQKWTVNGEVRIGFFTRRDVKAGEEITFDYQLQRYGREAQVCYCGSASCRGWIGGGQNQQAATTDDDSEATDSQQEDEDEDEEEEGLDEQQGESSDDRARQEVDTDTTVVPAGRRRSADATKSRASVIGTTSRRKAAERREVENEINRLQRNGGLKSKQHTLQLSRLMVRSDSDSDRLAMLQLIRTADAPCRRLFLDYHGLRLIWSWMTIGCTAADASAADNTHFRRQLLETLATLPIPNRSMLVESRVLTTVVRWSASCTSTTAAESTGDDSDQPATSECRQHTATTADEDIGSLCRQLLESWSSLQDVFRIPKKERIELMREHEKEADRGYQTYLKQQTRSQPAPINKKGYNCSSTVSAASGLASLSSALERRVSGAAGARHAASPSRPPDSPGSAAAAAAEARQATEERRRQFQLEVQRQEVEVKQRLQQQQMWSGHEARCILLGLDPHLTPIFDPSYQYYWEPSSGSWQPYTPGDSSVPLVPAAGVDPAFIASLPQQLTVYQSIAATDPNQAQVYLEQIAQQRQQKQQQQEAANVLSAIKSVEGEAASASDRMVAPRSDSPPSGLGLMELLQSRLPGKFITNDGRELSILKAAAAAAFDEFSGGYTGGGGDNNRSNNNINNNNNNKSCGDGVAGGSPPGYQLASYTDPAQPNVTITNVALPCDSSDTRASKQPPPPPELLIKLPPNWRLSKDEHGRFYYYHLVSRQSQWEPPVFPDSTTTSTEHRPHSTLVEETLATRSSTSTSSGSGSEPLVSSTRRRHRRRHDRHALDTDSSDDRPPSLARARRTCSSRARCVASVSSDDDEDDGDEYVESDDEETRQRPDEGPRREHSAGDDAAPQTVVVCQTGGVDGAEVRDSPEQHKRCHQRTHKPQRRHRVRPQRVARRHHSSSSSCSSAVSLLDSAAAAGDGAVELGDDVEEGEIRDEVRCDAELERRRLLHGTRRRRRRRSALVQQRIISPVYEDRHKLRAERRRQKRLAQTARRREKRRERDLERLLQKHRRQVRAHAPSVHSGDTATELAEAAQQWVSSPAADTDVVPSATTADDCGASTSATLAPPIVDEEKQRRDEAIRRFKERENAISQDRHTVSAPSRTSLSKRPVSHVLHSQTTQCDAAGRAKKRRIASDASTSVSPVCSPVSSAPAASEVVAECGSNQLADDNQHTPSPSLMSDCGPTSPSTADDTGASPQPGAEDEHDDTTACLSDQDNEEMADEDVGGFDVSPEAAAPTSPPVSVEKPVSSARHHHSRSKQQSHRAATTAAVVEQKSGGRRKETRHHRSTSSKSPTNITTSTTDKHATSGRSSAASDKKIKEKFLARMSAVVVSVLNSYRKTDCQHGRITCTDDFKYLAKKLTHHVMLKELKNVRHVRELNVSESVKHKAKYYVKKYMARCDAVFSRHNAAHARDSDND